MFSDPIIVLADQIVPHRRPRRHRKSGLHGMRLHVITAPLCADVAELVDALGLGPSAARRGGSSPSIRTSLRSQCELRLGRPNANRAKAVPPQPLAKADGLDRSQLFATPLQSSPKFPHSTQQSALSALIRTGKPLRSVARLESA
tara:strand:+ start:14093 stop:14527 length:435 start_codon:yes stop_codon:yes gene_type:complete